jgi:hypothetical protein
MSIALNPSNAADPSRLYPDPDGVYDLVYEETQTTGMNPVLLDDLFTATTDLPDCSYVVWMMNSEEVVGGNPMTDTCMSDLCMFAGIPPAPGVNIASNLDDGYPKDSVILFDSATPYYYDDVRISAYSYGMNGV